MQLQYYVGENQKVYDIYVQILAYTSNAQVDMSTNTNSVSLVLLRYPPRQTTVSQLSALGSDSYVSTSPRWPRLIHQCEIAAL